MLDLKHVGRIKKTGRKCLVAFRTLPGDAFNSLIVTTENLTDQYHDALIQLVESASGQSCFEFAEVLARSKFPDGSTMLPALHAQGKLAKVPTDLIEMTPNFTTTILLSELNQLIAEQRGVPVDQLAVQETNPSATGNTEIVDVAKVKDLSAESRTTSESVSGEVVVDPNAPPEDQAKKFRSEADRLSKQAAALRRQAEELVPTKKAK
jgi:hypothetical protein